ncbi:MAG: GWxTD domain-containing protein [Acidobacteria bacterium]|nr:GWxTD domain-containing protein [Acidobacteriota bacterium]
MSAVGWALVQFVWQGAAIALVLAFAIRWTASPRVRHGLAVMALVAMLLSFVVTTVSVLPVGTGAVVEAGQGVELARGVVIEAGKVGVDWKWALPYVTWLWAVGVLGLGLKRVGGWWMTRRLTRIGVCAVAAHWQPRMRELALRMGVGDGVALLESSLVEVPVVVGWLKPVLLMPVGMMAGMPATQIEAILLHELAHVWRRDALVNGLQSVVESVLFYHPAVWWVSGLIREEREKCCDDLVVALQGDAHAYATALLTLEEKRAFALAANGGNLMKRLERMARREETRPGLASLLVPLGVLTAVFAFAGVAQELKGPYVNWLTQDVVYIIDAKEKAAFVALKTDDEREKFIEEFWKRRDETPDTLENEAKEEHYRRIRYANERFRSSQSGWKTDLGRVYITYGPPDEIEILSDRAHR